MKRIVQEEHWFTMTADGVEEPQIIPPDYHVYACEDSPLLLTVRLHSTRSGSAAWRAGAKARQALNNAPFRPVLRALVSEFVWWPPNTARHRPPRWFLDHESGYVLDDVVCQFGDVLNFFARVVSPQPDPLRDFIAGLLPPQGRLRARQGRLEVYEATVPEEQLQPLWGDTCHTFYNHDILGLSYFTYRVLGGQAYGILVPPFGRYEIAVVSRDHMDSPIRLSGECYDEDEKCEAFLLVHPVPLRAQRGVD